MLRTDFAQMHCSLARALEVFGDPWSTLVLRDLHIGFEHFGALQRDLGISSNVLSDRLDRLVERGVVERIPSTDHSQRFTYGLTAKGQDALSVLLVLVAWGDRWEDDGAGPPTEFRHSACGNKTVPRTCCSSCGGELRADEVSYHRGPGAAADHGTRLLGERLHEPIDDAGRRNVR